MEGEGMKPLSFANNLSLKSFRIPQLSWHLTGSPATYLPWAFLLILPFLINLIFWNTMVHPVRANLAKWQDTKALSEIRPQLEGLIAESNQMVTGWDESIFKKDDPSSAMQTIQRLASENRVQVKGMQTSIHEEASAGKVKNPMGLTEMPVNLVVAGSYAKLAQWLNALEEQHGLRINSWSLQQSTDADRLLQLSLSVSVLLRESK